VYETKRMVPLTVGHAFAWSVCVGLLIFLAGWAVLALKIRESHNGTARLGVKVVAVYLPSAPDSKVHRFAP
jgi:hypothetical protein